MADEDTAGFDVYARMVAGNFAAAAALADEVDRAATMIVAAIRNGGKVLLCGNGGSAADLQHLAAELLGRYHRDRAPLPAIALTVDTSALTAIGNDLGFEDVFARQLRGLGRAGDLLIALSTSGNSTNVIAALEAARSLGIASIGLTGTGGGMMLGRCDLLIRAPATETNHIQELHIAIGHYLCGRVEAAVA